ncbi:hypothetical protein ACFV7R_39635 [Streptomyces sp. NPDC059866]|uniref:hypothetical protein n=1 Tax=Streptomyces sp. NPDC059866 TaxID=3346978 RepID=UPI003660B85E
MRHLKRTAVAIAGCAVWGVGLSAPQAQAASAEHSGAVNSVEAGYVLACQGQAGERFVGVELYANSAHGNVVSVSVEGPDGQYGGGTNPPALFDDGTVSAELPIERLDGEGGAAGTAVIVGSYAPVGEPTRVHELYREPGWNVIATGVNQRLDSEVSVTLLGETVPLICGDAFAYDLRVTRTPA